MGPFVGSQLAKHPGRQPAKQAVTGRPTGDRRVRRWALGGTRSQPPRKAPFSTDRHEVLGNCDFKQNDVSQNHFDHRLINRNKK